MYHAQKRPVSKLNVENPRSEPEVDHTNRDLGSSARGSAGDLVGLDRGSPHAAPPLDKRQNPGARRGRPPLVVVCAAMDLDWLEGWPRRVLGEKRSASDLSTIRVSRRGRSSRSKRKEPASGGGGGGPCPHSGELPRARRWKEEWCNEESCARRHHWARYGSWWWTRPHSDGEESKNLCGATREQADMWPGGLASLSETAGKLRNGSPAAWGRVAEAVIAYGDDAAHPGYALTQAENFPFSNTTGLVCAYTGHLGTKQGG